MVPERGHIYALSSEWPTDPYLSVPIAERSRRLKLLVPDKISSLAVQLVPNPEIANELLLKTLNFLREPRGGQTTIKTIQIDLKVSARELKRRFDAYLKVHQGSKGRTNISNRVLRADLKALVAWRILRDNNGDWCHAGEPFLFAEQSEWIEAQKRAERIIRSIEEAG